MTVGGAMGSDVGRELKRLQDEQGIEMSAIVSRGGVPIAWNIDGEEHLDAFAALSATIIGATEVVYENLGRAVPRHIVIESGDCAFLAAPVGGHALLVGIVSGPREADFAAVLDRAVAAVKIALAKAGFAF